MTALEMLNRVLADGHVALDMDLTVDKSTVAAMVEHLLAEKNLKMLKILEVDTKTLHKYLKHKEQNLRVCAALTLLNRSFPQLALGTYVTG
jgi:hypothetical protein